MRVWISSLALVLLGGCQGAPDTKDAYRIKGEGGIVIQCATAKDTECGLTLKNCSTRHEFHCLHGVDLELVAASEPAPAITVPPAPAPAPAPQPAPAPAPAPAAPSK